MKLGVWKSVFLAEFSISGFWADFLLCLLWLCKEAGLAKYALEGIGTHSISGDVRDSFASPPFPFRFRFLGVFLLRDSLVFFFECFMLVFQCFEGFANLSKILGVFEVFLGLVGISAPKRIFAPPPPAKFPADTRPPQPPGNFNNKPDLPHPLSGASDPLISGSSLLGSVFFKCPKRPRNFAATETPTKQKITKEKKDTVFPSYRFSSTNTRNFGY